MDDESGTGLHFGGYCEAIDAAVGALGPAEAAGWRCAGAQGAPACAWDDPALGGAAVVLMRSDMSSYVECYASVEWGRGRLRLTRQDTKTGALDAAWDVALPEPWLAALRAQRWPTLPPGTGPWF